MFFAHTYFSLKYGVFSPAELVQCAGGYGVDTLVLTDINNTSCAFDFIVKCRNANIRPLLGIEFRNNGRLLYTGIARNSEGFRELCSLLTRHSHDDKPLPEVPPQMEHVYIIYTVPPRPVDDFTEYEFIGIRPGMVNKVFSAPWRRHTHKMVAYCPVTFPDKRGYQTHRILRAIDLNTIISRLGPEDLATQDEHFYTVQDLERIYGAYPDMLRNAQRLFDTCTIDMPADDRNNRQSFTGSKNGDMSLLTKLTENGAAKRYRGKVLAKAVARIQKELGVIAQLGFAPYFLITWDIIRYGQSVGYNHVGRGSGANSIVAYCLYITDVDPLELDLYFERFINPYRTSPPDFDIDFSWSDRDDVTDYIFKRYGKEYTALLGTYNTFKGRSILREIGKVAGLPKPEIDLMVKQPLARDRHHPLAESIFKYGKLIEGFPNYLSIHAGGVLISERPLNYHTALQMMPKGFPITHFDMYGAEDLGFHKYDILSQRGLGHIRDTVELVRQNRNETVDIHDMPKIKEDEKVKAQLRSGQCIGCFYIESPAMRGLLSKLRCDNYTHLVAASSIIRPGVAKSGMMREYIQRFHRPESFEYIHSVFAQHLGETFGIMVYQEDVMKIVHHFAGLDLDESDILRRIMSGKKKTSDTFERLMTKYFENCRQRGYPDELAQEVWRQVESFSGYSFCKAHSASYAAESFQSLFLKSYYPLEFMVAVINNFGGFYHTELYVHEARMQGGNIHAPCVNHSRYLTTIDGNDIWLGFIHLNGMERKIAQAITNERERDGHFLSLADFTSRVDIASDQLDLLIRIGAFRFTGYNKYELMWEKNAVYNPEVKVCEGIRLFREEAETYTLPVLAEGPFDQAFDEIELLGFPLCSPFELVENLPRQYIAAEEMLRHAGRHVYMLGYYVTTKPVTTIKRELMQFGTWVDTKGQFFDTVHFPDSLKKFPFKGRGVYYICGRIVLDFGFPNLEVDRMEKLPYVKDVRY